MYRCRSAVYNPLCRIAVPFSNNCSSMFCRAQTIQIKVGVMAKIKEFVKKVAQSKMFPLVLAAVFVILGAFVAFGGNFDKKNQQTSVSQSYVDELSSKMVSVIQKIDGVGRADVVLSLSTQGACDYAYETKSQTIGDKTTQTTSLVLVKGEPLVVKTYTPVVGGVVVVAEGADDPVVRYKIVNVVVTLTDVSAENVRVFTYKD